MRRLFFPFLLFFSSLFFVVGMMLFCKLLLQVVAGEVSRDGPAYEAFVLSIPSFC